MTDLTKITTPFGLLDPETQGALMAHKENGGTLQVWSCRLGWQPYPLADLSKAGVFRAAPGSVTPAPAPEPVETLRDRFAMAALTGMLSNPTGGYGWVGADVREAYACADAMLKARKKPND